jgi:hypothetical protein
MLLRGRFDRFEVVEQPAPLTDLWAVSAFNGVLRCAGFTALLRLDGEELAPDSAAMERAESFYDLQSVGPVLWSFGMKDVMKFDGHDWIRIDEVEVS